MPSPAVMGIPVSFDFDEFTDSYIADLKQTLDDLPRGPLREFWRMVENTRANDGSIHFIGNGGSAATPSHSAGDWSKELGLRTIAHTDNAASVTAWANDTNFTNIFVGQLSTFLREGDLVVAYSGSGKSANVLNGMHYAKQQGCSTVAVTGNITGSNRENNGNITDIADISIVAPTGSMERIEDIQLVINHIIKEAVKAHNGL
jgi:D-sedoheptulose 7-phosphate isomerase